MTTMTSETEKAMQQLRLNDQDTGSPQVQVVLLTGRINQLSAHFQQHKKDFHSRAGLLRMVSQRRRLLGYLKRHNETTYRKVLEALNLRK